MSIYEPIAISFLSPFNTNAESHILMPLRAYYDASGKPYHKTGFVTLAGIAACQNVWPAFEHEWQSVLNQYPTISELHTTDAMAQQEEFEGWRSDDIDSMFIKFFNVLGKLRVEHIEALSCTVKLEDYQKAKKAIPNLRPPEAMCVDFCTGSITLPIEDEGQRKCVVFYFDRGDEFMHQINRVWERAKKRRLGWPDQVAAIVPVSSQEVLPVQAADMYAWFINNHYTNGTQEFGYWSLSMALAHRHRMYDYATMIERYPNG